MGDDFKFKQVFDKNPIPFMLYHLLKNENGEYTAYEIVYANEAAADLLQMKIEEMQGETISPISKKRLELLVKANREADKVNDVQYDAHSEKYLGLTAYRDAEGYIAFIMNDMTEQYHQRELLQIERDRYSHLLDAVPGGIAVFEVVRSTSVYLKYFNDEIGKITGYSPEEIENRGAGGVCEAVPEDLGYAHEQALRAIEGETTVEFEYRTRKKNGELRFLGAKMAVERTGEETHNVYIVYTDITLQKRAEQEIALEFTNLVEVQENHLLGKCRANVTKNIIDHYIVDDNLDSITDNSKYSDTVTYIAGTCGTEKMSQDLRKVMMPEHLIHLLEDGKHEENIEYMRNMKDGRQLWVRTKIKLYTDPETQDVMCFMYTYDIDQEKTMQLIIDHVAEKEFDMMGLLYQKRDILHCVKASDMERTMECGVDVQYSVGVHEYIDRYIPPELREEARKKLVAEAIYAELDEKPEYVLTYPVYFEGKEYHKKWRYSYLDNSREVVIFTRADVTSLFEEQEFQRENLKNALLQAKQASHAKTDFLSHMSHEIRTPMNAIIGMTALAAQCVDKPKEVSECISKIGISSRFLLSLINDILDMSRIESGKVTLKKEKFSFEELVNNINSLVYNQAKDKGIDYECSITSFTSPYYIGDVTKIQQILINLLGNAIKFTPSGGRTQFMIHQSKVENKKAYLSFTINDTGVGISEEFQKRMFEPFEQDNHNVTTSYQGTGLGLAICKNLVDMMGGTINVNSIEGVGTEFTVKLVLDTCEDENICKLQPDIAFGTLKALVVDDDVLICEHTQGILKEMGIRAEWVCSGKQAVALVDDKQKKESFYDIILLDWKMPEMDGIETARAIRRIVGPDVTIIVITAYDWTEIEAEAKAAGVNMLITKPLFKSTLIPAFQQVFNEKIKKEEESQSKEYDFTGRKVLLVEDHILNVEVAKRLLEGKHAMVEVAENGLRAIEMFAKAPDNYYDIILMDIRMPIMDGLTATRSIRQLSNPYAKTVPIIAMSANAFDEDIEMSQAAGMNAHLSKPIEPEHFFAVIDRYFL